MGYPMTYARVVGRNRLNGPGYEASEPRDGKNPEWVRAMIRGDMRRLELDQRDELHLKKYAEHAGITVEQAKKVLDLFFNEDYAGQKFSDA